MENNNKKFTEWHGVPRETIHWNPVVNEDMCIGCGLCVTSCGRGVYKFDYKNEKSVVASPNNCLFGCQTCANLCPVKAISFAENDKTRDKAQKIIKKLDVLPRIKEELEKRKEDLMIK